MTLFGYKEYQQRTLRALSEYLTLARDMGAKKAFVYQTEHVYHSLPQLPGLPYICLRVPTGGGKTVLACHSIHIVLEEFLRQERGLVLWLVPTNTIKDQTLTALRNRKHPYRQVLDATLEGKVTAMDLTEALSLQRAVLDGETVVIVSTLAALRVQDTEGRKVYEASGSLMAHFDGLTGNVLGSLEKYEGTDKVVPSLANVLKLRRPLIVVDEAHNARTELSFDTLERFNPSCIVEFTATPRVGNNGSNVLYQVSAAELKAESMVKLPIQVQLAGIWTDAIAAAITMQAKLETDAAQEEVQTGRYLRPIVLLQGQPKHQELTVEVVKQRLLDSGVPPDHIAIETGTVQELGDRNLFAPDCPVRYIITVDKLREGWDCSFAYILCSVREMGSGTAIEQILGRVLRMPEAERKQTDSLNTAYAFVTSQNFRGVAETLTGALVANGFTKYEAQREIEQGELDLGGLFSPQQVSGTRSPSERGEPFSVPQLALLTDGELEPIDEDTFLRSGWTLSGYSAALSEQEFPSQVGTENYVLDVNAQGAASVQQSEAAFVTELQRQLAWLAPQDISSAAELSVWLDRHIPHPDLTQMQASLFLYRLVDGLVTDRGLTLQQLSRERLRLRDAAERKIKEHRKVATLHASQQLLFDAPPVELQVSAECVFTFRPDEYPANPLYQGAYKFQKHFYPILGDMNGEEVECARVLDMLPNVKFWVRNLERRTSSSFWFQTSTDKFYPDFVAMLEDGRILALEYKGEDRITNDDTKEKRKLGELWAARSNGQCLFQLVGKNEFVQSLKSLAPQN